MLTLFISYTKLTFWPSSWQDLDNLEEVVIQKSRFHGLDTLDIRTWVETSNYKGFTRKGVNIPVKRGEALAQDPESVKEL